MHELSYIYSLLLNIDLPVPLAFTCIHAQSYPLPSSCALYFMILINSLTKLAKKNI